MTRQVPESSGVHLLLGKICLPVLSPKHEDLGSQLRLPTTYAMWVMEVPEWVTGVPEWVTVLLPEVQSAAGKEREWLLGQVTAQSVASAVRV